MAATASSVNSQVYEWEFVDPANPSLGKRQSTTLAPDGATASYNDPFNVIGLLGRNLTKAYLYGANIPQYRVSTTILDNAYLADAQMFNLQGDKLKARGADMSGSLLEKARFVNADLSLTSFVSANLTGANLGGANLSGADFTDSNVIGANMSGVTANGFAPEQLYATASYHSGNLGAIDLSSNDLRGWDFRGQQMIRSNFYSTQLLGTSFDNAIIKDARFGQGELTPTQLYSSASYQMQDLGAIDFLRADLSSWDFSGQSMIDANLLDANVGHTDFSGANLSLVRIGKRFTVFESTDFQGANLTGLKVESDSEWRNTDFRDANLTDADFDDVRFVNCLFENATLQGIQMDAVTSRGFSLENLYSTASFKSGDLTRVVFSRNDFTGADFRNINMSQASLSRSTLDNADFRNANLTEASFHAAKLNNADFRGATLVRASLAAESLLGAQFQGADLTKASFGDADLTGADLTDSIIFGADFSNAYGAKFTEAQLYSTASYRSGELGSIQIRGDFSGWDFRNQNLAVAYFDRDSIIDGALWTGATLNGAQFFVNSLKNSDFSQADVRNVRFSSSHMEGSNFANNDLTGVYLGDGFLQGSRFDGARFENATVIFMDLTNVGFVGADLRYASFIGNVYSSTDFTDADIRHAQFSNATAQGFTIFNLVSTRSYQDHDLTGVNLKDCEFPGIDLAGVNLTKSIFDRTVFDGASFASVNLTDASFNRASFMLADFNDALLEGTNLAGTTQEGFTQGQLYSTRSYQARKLRRVNLSSNDLSGWDFSNVDLTQANFTGANLTNAKFDGASIRDATFNDAVTGSLTREQITATASYQAKNLRGVGLRGSNLDGSDFSGFQLEGVNLENASLHTVNFSLAQILGASFRKTTSKGFSDESLYLTANFVQHDLRGIDFGFNTLIGWDFSNQNLMGASFGGVSSNSIVTFYQADLRGAFVPAFLLNKSQTGNTILPDGKIQSFSLGTNQHFVLRNYDPVLRDDYPYGRGDIPVGVDPIGIKVDIMFNMNSPGRLELIFDDEEWHSTISFSQGTPVKLGGVLELSFGQGVDLALQVGRTFQVFDWSGVTPSGKFAIHSDTRFGWDVSSLYTTGKIKLVAIPEPCTLTLLMGVFALTTQLRQSAKASYRS